MCLVSPCKISAHFDVHIKRYARSRKTGQPKFGHDLVRIILLLFKKI
jgi:hypothetical protein